MSEAPIKIWPFNQAPVELRDLSTNGGDEDWIAILPSDMETPCFLAEGSAFGCFFVDRIECDGFSVLIGCHS